MKEKVKKAEIIIQQTDKSGRNTVDSPANYKISVQPHITNDDPISEEEYEELEKEINAHTHTWCKILQIGKKTNSHDRIKNSLKTKNSDYTVLSLGRKDKCHHFFSPRASGRESSHYYQSIVQRKSQVFQ